MGIWSCVGLRQESVHKSPSGEVGTDYCSQWGSKQSLRCKPDRWGFKVVEGGLASGTDRDTISGSGGRVRTCGLINHNVYTRLKYRNSLCSGGYLGARSSWYTGPPHYLPRFPKAL